MYFGPCRSLVFDPSAGGSLPTGHAGIGLRLEVHSGILKVLGVNKSLVHGSLNTVIDSSKVVDSQCNLSRLFGGCGKAHFRPLKRSFCRNSCRSARGMNTETPRIFVV